MTLLEQAEYNLKLARAQYIESLKRGDAGNLTETQLHVQRAYTMRYFLRGVARPRVFVFEEDAGTVRVYRNPEAWADDMLATRDLPRDVIVAVLQRFPSDEVPFYSNAAASFYWREVL